MMLPPPDETATYNLLKEHLGEVLNGLPPRERVRQIEAQALSRLRHPTIRRKLRDYLGE